MEKEQFNTPILFIVFNRPDTTKVVFEEIRKLRPSKLFIAADGPRPGREDDIKNCSEVREIVSKIDWPCELKTLFREKNLGCRIAPPTAVSWFFENIEEGIIIEDDCVPHPSFFYFCRELLEKYRDDKEVMHLSGNNFQHENKDFICNNSYYFTKIPQMWGWASWRRAWQLYDTDMRDWPLIKRSKKLKNIVYNRNIVYKLEDFFDSYYNGKNSWDGQWFLVCILNGICINAKTNLIKNIGFDDRATHTKNESSELSDIPIRPIEFPLKHPESKSIDTQADYYSFVSQFGVDNSIISLLKNRLKSNFPSLFSHIKKIIHD